MKRWGLKWNEPVPNPKFTLRPFIKLRDHLAQGPVSFLLIFELLLLSLHQIQIYAGYFIAAPYHSKIYCDRYSR